ncbi:MAG: hypothetical protein ACJ8LG_14715 [Massilia sp.]
MKALFAALVSGLLASGSAGAAPGHVNVGIYAAVPAQYYQQPVEVRREPAPAYYVGPGSYYAPDAYGDPRWRERREWRARREEQWRREEWLRREEWRHRQWRREQWRREHWRHERGGWGD